MRPLGSIPPLPHPLRTLRVARAKSRVTRFGRRVRRGRKIRSRVARVTLRPEAVLAGERSRGTRDMGAAEDWTPPEAGEMGRLVVAGPAPVRLTVEGVKRQTAPEGRPPVQAKVIVEWKSQVGVAVRVTGFEGLPWAALVEAVEGERVKAPAALAMVRVAGAERLA